MKMQGRLKKHSLKFISLFLSVFLWVYVLNSEKVKFEKGVAIDYILPIDMVFAEKPPQDVTFLIEGPRAFMRTVSEREDRLVIDLNKVNTKKQNNFFVDINPSQLNLPFGMIVERVIPRRLPIRLEKKVGKIVPLKLHFTGELPDKLSLEKAQLEPSEVEVTGPKSVVSKLKSLSVKPVDLDNLSGLDQVPVELQIPDERLVVAGGFDVKLNYQLKAASSNVTLKNLPIRFLSDKRTIKSKVKTAQLKVLIPEKLKNRSNVSSNVQVWADIPREARGRVEVPLKVILPPSVHLLEVIPKTIIVNVQ